MTWNMRTLLRTGKMDELTGKADRKDLLPVVEFRS